MQTSTLTKTSSYKRGDGRVFSLRLVSVRDGLDCHYRVERDGVVLDRGEMRLVPTTPKALASVLFLDGAVRWDAAVRAAKKLLASSWTAEDETRAAA